MCRYGLVYTGSVWERWRSLAKMLKYCRVQYQMRNLPTLYLGTRLNFQTSFGVRIYFHCYRNFETSLSRSPSETLASNLCLTRNKQLLALSRNIWFSLCILSNSITRKHNGKFTSQYGNLLNLFLNSEDRAS
jgi:hypothetical protein